MPAEHLRQKLEAHGSAFTDVHRKSHVKWANGVPVSDPMVKSLPRLVQLESDQCFHVSQIISGFTKAFDAEM